MKCNKEYFERIDMITPADTNAFITDIDKQDDNEENFYNKDLRSNEMRFDNKKPQQNGGINIIRETDDVLSLESESRATNLIVSLSLFLPSRDIFCWL